MPEHYNTKTLFEGLRGQLCCGFAGGLQLSIKVLTQTAYPPIGGQLGQALCKLLPVFGSVSFVVSIQNLILIAVDRFGVVVFPLCSPLIRSKLCPFLILATWMFAIVFISPDLLAFELVEYQEGARCARRWKKVFGESLSFASVVLAHNILFTYIPVLLLVILYSIIFIKLKTPSLLSKSLLADNAGTLQYKDTFSRP